MTPTLSPYTVLLMVPGQIQEKAGQIETFLAHVEAFSVPHAIAQAQDMASVERDCEDLADQFESLLVIAGHHDDLLP